MLIQMQKLNKPTSVCELCVLVTLSYCSDFCSDLFEWGSGRGRCRSAWRGSVCPSQTLQKLCLDHCSTSSIGWWAGGSTQTHVGVGEAGIIGLMLWLAQEMGCIKDQKTHELGLAHFDKQIWLGCSPAGQEPIKEQHHLRGNQSSKAVNPTSPAGRSRFRSTISKVCLDREDADLIAAWLSTALLPLIKLMRVPAANPAWVRCALQAPGTTSHRQALWQMLLAALTWGDEAKAVMSLCPTVPAQWRKEGFGLNVAVG